MATLIPCLVELRAEFNRIAPGRGKGSDGWIGDAAHQAEKSDHNPDARGLVHAIDVDVDLNESDLTMEKVVQFTLGRCRSGAERRITYIIYNRRIWSRSHGWVQRTYTGASPHTEHAHFSGDDEPALENNTSSWHLEEIPVALTQADKEWIAKEIRAVVDDRKDDYAEAGVDAWGKRGVPRINPQPGQSETVTYGSLLQWSEDNNHVEADRVIAALTPPVDPGA